MSVNLLITSLNWTDQQCFKLLYHTPPVLTPNVNVNALLNLSYVVPCRVTVNVAMWQNKTLRMRLESTEGPSLSEERYVKINLVDTLFLPWKPAGRAERV